MLRVSLAALGDGVDGGEGEAEQSIARTRNELVCGSLGQFDSLVLDVDATDVDGISADVARGRTTIAVGDLPSQAGRGLPSRGLGGVEDCVA